MSVSSIIFIINNIFFKHKIKKCQYYINMFFRVRVRLGAYTRSQVNGFQEIDAAKLIKHEKFVVWPVWNNDIGLIKLSERYTPYGKCNWNDIIIIIGL